ncbi:hypothetical protein GCM10029976_008810 [Kribbella albertanoniae]|uniref:hypothetical protein n=1 Tax=Kribbella albertanoniae TaxID=1266829 RepID=UPI00140456BA|nr:hypothetical protein [Kribbella albertanoniae]
MTKAPAALVRLDDTDLTLEVPSAGSGPSRSARAASSARAPFWTPSYTYPPFRP